MTTLAIRREDVLRMAELARLSLDDAQIERMTKELGAILEYMHVLNELDTSAVTPTAQVGVDALATRPDQPTPGLVRDSILAESPRPAHDGFCVPAFLDE